MSKTRRWIGVLVFAFGTTGCQDYGFEDLDTNTFTKMVLEYPPIDVAPVDILFVIDNSGSMVGEQQQLAKSFRTLADQLDLRFGADKYHLGVVTPGMLSDRCPKCSSKNKITESCMNESGESGRLQDSLGLLESLNPPTFRFRRDPNCRVIDASAKRACFFDDTAQEGTVLVGTNGCGYERGLEAIRAALDYPLQDTYNAGFMRPDTPSDPSDDTILAVVVVSDEEDCGKVGDVNEGPGFGGDTCYHASLGHDPLGNPVKGLTPVDETYEFLMGLKNGQPNKVKFMAIVGVDEAGGIEATRIEYRKDKSGGWKIKSSCFTPKCCAQSPCNEDTDGYCSAKPGTRYIELAKKFGLEKNGFVDTICTADFSPIMLRIVERLCPKEFPLPYPIRDPSLANILLNGNPIPRFSCGDPVAPSPATTMIVCDNATDTKTCPVGQACLRTWNYLPPNPTAPGGTLAFSSHYNPCSFIERGTIRLQVEAITR